MKSLKEKINFLQRKEAEVELYKLVIKNLEAEKEDPEGFPGLMDEVRKAIATFCDSQIANIENSINVVQQVPKAPEASKPAPKPQEAAPPAPVEPPKPEEPGNGVTELMIQDPVKFITFFKHKLKKPVKIVQGNGKKDQGELVGIAYPNVMVEVNGMRVQVDPFKLEW